MENNIKSFGLRRNIYFIYENFKLLLKKFVEYKSNLYASFLFFIIWYVSQIFFILIISNNFGSEIGWTLNEFVLFTILTNVVWSLLGLFKWGHGLFFTLSKGNLNVLLTKPLNHKFKYYFYELDEVGFFYLISNFFYVFILFFYFDVQINYNLVAIIALILNTLFFTFLWLGIDSLNFYSLKLSELIRPFGQIEYNLQYYPGNFFDNNKFKYFLMIFPLYFIGVLLVPLFTQNSVNIEIYYLFILLLVLTIISYLFLLFNWYYGLKRYEAFG